MDVKAALAYFSTQLLQFQVSHGVSTLCQVHRQIARKCKCLCSHESDRPTQY